MSRGQHAQANQHRKGSRGGRLMAKLGLSKRRVSLTRLRKALVKP